VERGVIAGIVAAAPPGTVVVRIPTRGPFSLAELGTFGYGHLHAQPWDGVWRLAFVVDGGHGHAGVAVRQVAPQELELTVEAAPEALDAVVRQVARIASCDHDGDAFAALGEHDPVLRRLIEAAPGLRPPLFASPYEAAVWCLLTHRRSRRQGTVLRDRIAREHGVRFEVAGRELWAMPGPDRLLAVDAVPGLPGEQLARIHAVAAAAQAGQLDVDRLGAMDPAEAMRDLERIRGIGPFSSALVVVRACGLADVLPLQEPRSRSAVARAYGLPDPLSDAAYLQLAEGWRPFRTWVAVLARAAGDRVPAGE
jgi:DNA-3-methyladenine glycosylase II